ncbi:50S ribosomal protein L37ae [Nanoarchaeota archaeon]
MGKASEKASKGFGARYGPRVRQKWGKITALQRSNFKCPYCSYDKVRRKAVGIWHCNKCDSTFTNKAYRVDKISPIKIQEEKNE